MELLHDNNKIKIRFLNIINSYWSIIITVKFNIDLQSDINYDNKIYYIYNW